MIVKSILFFDSTYNALEVSILYISRLRDLREDHDLPQKQVAALLGIDQRVYSNYELGKRTLPLPHLVTLADYYHVSTDYLLGRTDDPRPYPAPRRK
mgnify:FL=1